MPSKIRHSPFPPASTTPAFFSTGKSFGVSSSAASAPRQMAAQTNSGSASSSNAIRPFSHATRATVRMVPSVGFITALYAASTPIASASTKSAPVAAAFPSKPFANPLKSRERITPELPRAPRSIADAAVFATSAALTLSNIPSSCAAALMVIDILVPVSPSGTGKIFSSSTAVRFFKI